ncbi:MFS transporter [Rhodococcus triatomae]|uniref:Nitrate/nitrite transporter NarK n=1 Tax=Rhodococcus triatomae TaxID=300028 RepID=A0A1G8GJL5_9NOCA|nr:MFS transporter [Rhodococcus triatomae]QNG20358.1 MFS transporter [Rhodococcus triatomae]QNG23726.1 MFS transporter [Rhodococcus triatomae]SDH94584.1 Nitrate/nitrite transporter NarK [Rhodococcus triatomae]
MNRVWWVWGVGVFAYVVAVLHRTSFGVSGLAASERFSAGPGVLSSFVVLQIVVYAGMQIPAGVLLDRFGSRAMISTGAVVMASGQLALALTESLPVAIAARVLVGAGDAFTFIAVLRLVPQWFAPRRVPLVSQLTGITGQLGQVLSAVPFTILLADAGWTTAYSSAAALGVLAFVLSLAVVRNSPPGLAVIAAPAGLREVGRQVRAVFANHGARLGFFTHMGTQFSITTFALLWGVPYLMSAQGLSATAAGALLSLSVVTAITSGIVIGILSGRYPMRRSLMVLTVMSSSAVMWAVVLALPGPAPMWLLCLLVIVISVGGPGSMIGFDFARMMVPSTSMGTAQGLVNSGGFLATLIVLQSMGLILDAMGGYTFESFRVAWCVQYVIWAIAVTGVLVFRRRARAEMGVTVRPLRDAWRDRRG